MGVGPSCTCAEPPVSAAPRRSRLCDGAAVRGKDITASDGIGPGRTPGGQLACGACATWLVAKGCAIRVRWAAPPQQPQQRHGEFYDAPPVLLPNVVAVPARVVQVAAGEAHALLLTCDFRVFGCGNNEYGQLGLGDARPRQDSGSVAWEVSGLPASSFVAGIACGGHVSAAFSQRGDVWTWGRNEESGVLGQGFLPVVSVPAPSVVGNLRRKVRAVQLATSGWASFCVSHLGAIYSWGGGLCGVHGHGHQENEPSAKVVRAMQGTPVAQVSAGALHTLAVSCGGEVFAWGRVSGAFGPEAQLQLVPKIIDVLEGIRVVQVAAGGDHSLALAESGEVYAWGALEAGALGFPRGLDPMQRCALVHRMEDLLQCMSNGAVEVACGRCHSTFMAPGAAKAGAVRQQRMAAAAVAASMDKLTDAYLAPSEQDRDSAPSKSKGVWLRGKGVPPSEHAASMHEGMLANPRGPANALLSPPGPTLHLTRLDLERILELVQA
eukprot:TRINITY_DN60979_c0_g1_i1.p1 TRINITY_DN60979_c0_g1~~TRINITY_DN60979_c0_g1_i1.p1  ORF type:complete len:494 (+),score=76.90 TRINITY_DN60979_c0_g1_i1:400-1881(+)